ncbi:MAG TPA: hypothetical protein VNK03_04925 [Gammaproteobacteria bacterium]|nr:hypothetical protein [Gammaproteobacteria bacterium]
MHDATDLNGPLFEQTESSISKEHSSIVDHVFLNSYSNTPQVSSISAEEGNGHVYHLSDTPEGSPTSEAADDGQVYQLANSPQGSPTSAKKEEQHVFNPPAKSRKNNWLVSTILGEIPIVGHFFQEAKCSKVLCSSSKSVLELAAGGGAMVLAAVELEEDVTARIFTLAATMMFGKAMGAIVYNMLANGTSALRECFSRHNAARALSIAGWDDHSLDLASSTAGKRGSGSVVSSQKRGSASLSLSSVDLTPQDGDHDLGNFLGYNPYPEDEGALVEIKESAAPWRNHWFVKNALSEVPIVGHFFRVEKCYDAFYSAGKSVVGLAGGMAAITLMPIPAEESLEERSAKLVVAMACGEAAGKVAYNMANSAITNFYQCCLKQNTACQEKRRGPMARDVKISLH